MVLKPIIPLNNKDILNKFTKRYDNLIIQSNNKANDKAIRVNGTSTTTSGIVNMIRIIITRDKGNLTLSVSNNESIQVVYLVTDVFINKHVVKRLLVLFIE